MTMKPESEYRSLYEITGSILDLNTLLVPRLDVRAASPNASVVFGGPAARERMLKESVKKRHGDNCRVCFGIRGGVLGNENIIDGVVMCDYCTADRMPDNSTGGTMATPTTSQRASYFTERFKKEEEEEEERWQMLVDQGKEAHELAKIMQDFADRNPKSLMLKELDK